MQLKTALLGPIVPLALLACDARATVEPAPAAPAASSEYKGIRQTSDAAKPGDRVPPRMEFVPAGKMETGLSEDEIQEIVEEERLSNPAYLKLFAASYPKHEVELAPYYMGEFELTNAEWKVYLDATGQEPSKDLVENVWIDGEIPAGHENRPVTFVSIPEVEAFCRWAMVRLPTEHEWTYAARGPDGGIYPWGNQFDAPVPKELQRRPRDAQEAEELEREREKLPQGGKMAWCADSRFPGPREPQPVGTMPEGVTPFGLKDAVGNVWEWTASPYSPYPDYEPLRLKTPLSRGRKEQVDAAAFFNRERRVIKGGAFDTPALALRTDIRQFEWKKAWNATIGFRIAKSAQPGLDAIAYARDDVGSYTFHEDSTPLKLDAIQAVELTHYDAEGRITGQQGIVFAPVSDWFKHGRLREAERDSLKAPLSIGVLITSEPSLYPPLPAGTYTIAFQAEDKRWEVPDNFEDTPSRDWTFDGWQEYDTTFKAKKEDDEKSSERGRRPKKDDEAPAEGEEGEEPEEEAEPTEEELELEKYRFRATAGSIQHDRRRTNLLIMNARGDVVAALPIDEVKDSTRASETKLDRDTIIKDRKKNLPKTERFTYTWSVALDGARKHVKFELPLRFEPDAIEAGKAGPSNVNAEAASEDR